MKYTNVFRANLEAYHTGKRRALNEGGTWSSKTYSILQLIIEIADGAREPILLSVVSESFPHLRRGVMRDFKRILGQMWDESRWTATTSTYQFKQAQVEFFSADDASKLRGGRRDILFINECNNITYEAFNELDIRTRKFTVLDWNPVSEFWAHECLIGKPENAYIHSTYKDVEDVIPEDVRKNIEAKKDTDPNWWNVYGLGLIGKVEGLVYPFFSQVDRLPSGGVDVIGVDFGFSGDPCAVVRNKIFEHELYSQEILYEYGLTNPDLSRRMEESISQRQDELYADSAEPKSIEELYRLGWDIKPCSKGPGSVEFRHQKTRQFKQYWTKDSLNCIKEQRNFRYITDKNGKLTEKTTHQWSHGMDARDYAVVGKLEPKEREAVVTYNSMSLVDDIIDTRF